MSWSSLGLDISLNFSLTAIAIIYTWFYSVFIDADKKFYSDYLNYILESPSATSVTTDDLIKVAEELLKEEGEAAEPATTTEPAATAEPATTVGAGGGHTSDERRHGGGKSLLREGGIVIVDNTLWKGIVLENVSEWVSE